MKSIILNFKFYFSLIITAIIITTVSCDDTYQLEIPFGVNSNEIILADSATSTNIMVYSTGDWDVKFQEPVNWASIDKIKGNKNNSILFSSSKNFGPARKVVLVLSKSGEEDILISIVQEGALIDLQFERNSVTLLRESAPVTIGLKNNLRYDLDGIEVEVIYDDEISEKWISQINITDSTFEFVSLDNNIKESRSARVYLRYTDGNETKRETYIDITQIDKELNVITFEELRNMIANSSDELLIQDESLALEGIVISENGNPNLETNPNTGRTSIDFTENDKTAYLQSFDGKYGFRLKTKTASDNNFRQFSKVTLSLNDLLLVKESNPIRYTLKDVKSQNLIIENVGSEIDVTPKIKSIQELIDDDIYTHVTLKDCEFAIPHGSYVFSNTGYVIQTNWNTGGTTSPRADTYPSVIRDRDGSSMTVLINYMVPWYKNSKPKGRGDMKGIIVHSKLERYGIEDGFIGKYSLRPLNESDVNASKAPATKTLVEWNWFANGHDTSGVDPIRKDEDGNVLPAFGVGKLFNTDSSASTGLGANFAHYANAASKGTGNSAMHYSTKWWNHLENRGEAFVFNFSTESIENASNFTVSFTQGGGSGTLTSMHFPTYWHIEYSTDGVNYTVLPDSKYATR